MKSINYHTNEEIHEESEAVATRKANYWRGFKACLVLVVLPIGVLFVVFCNTLINTIK